MNGIFDWCVRLLIELADMTGFTYKEINVILFVFLHPLITLVLFVQIVILKRKINITNKKSRQN